MTIKPATPTCNVCGAEKQETNHWLTLYSPDLLTLSVYNAIIDGDTHVCGHNCASILLARWMQTGKLEEVHAKASSQ